HGLGLDRASERRKTPDKVLSAVERNGNGLNIEQALSPQTRAMEALMMGLRLAEGVDLAVLENKTGLTATDILDMHEAETLSGAGFMEASAARLMVTMKGMPLLDAILPKIISDHL